MVSSKCEIWMREENHIIAKQNKKTKIWCQMSWQLLNYHCNEIAKWTFGALVLCQNNEQRANTQNISFVLWLFNLNLFDAKNQLH